MFNRLIILLAAAWQIESAFILSRTPEPARNSLVTGALLALSGLLSIFHDGFRYLSAAVAVWIVSFGGMTAPDRATLISNALVGIGVFVASLVEHPRIWVEPSHRTA
jgi:hypothetical protein